MRAKPPWCVTAALVASVLVAWLAPGAAPAYGQQLRARAYLDANPVALNQPFTLSVEISGAQGLDEQPTPPSLDEFARLLGSNTSTSMQIVNGRSSVTYTVQFRYLATVEGAFEIPSVGVRAGGQELRTNPIPVTVSTGGDGRATTPGPAGLASEDLFLVAQPSKRSIYENEGLVVEYRLFMRVSVESVNLLSLPGTEGFWVEEMPLDGQPITESATRNGVQYTTAVIRRVALFPTGSGSRTLEPLTIEAAVRLRRGGGLFDDFFGRGLLSSLEPVRASSAPVEIEVRPLPPGRPATFTGLVGSLEASASVDRAEVDAGDALTLTVRLSGEGNLRVVPAPELELPGDFETFEPEVSESISRGGGTVRGTRTFEYVIIPRAPGSRSIPGLDLAYFDVTTARYAHATTDPIALQVTGQAPSGLGGGVRSGVETLREDIRFIRLGNAALRPAGRSLFGAPRFWIVALLPLLAAVGALVARIHRDRLEGDVAYARRRRARQRARKRLRRARALAGEDDGQAFYAEASRALRGFLADKLNTSEAGLMTDQARGELERSNVDQGVVEGYVAAILRCDQQRFAPDDGRRDERGEFLSHAEALMASLDQEMRG